MRVSLVGADLEENLSLRYLAAPLVRAGHTVDILAFDTVDDRARVVDRLLDEPPDVVGMSVAFQHRLGDFKALARELRARGSDALVVWGGHIPTARPADVLDRVPEVDLVVRHDGEQTLLEAVEALTPFVAPGGQAPAGRPLSPAALERLARVDGLAFRGGTGAPTLTHARAVDRDLDALLPPLRVGAPTRHLGLGFAPIVGSRGCWQSCTYCSIQSYHRGRKGPRVRLRSVDSIADEMAALAGERSARIFCFHDENFFLPRPERTRERLASLRAALDARGVGRVAIVAKCRPDELSPALLDDARRVGVVRLYVGVENGSQPGLDHLGRRTTVEACARGLEMLRDAGMYACFNILLFEPDTTLDDVKQNISFLHGALDFSWNFCRTEVYPGAEIERRLRSQGRLRGGLDGMTYTIADPRVELLFRITAVAFGGRCFGDQSTANALSGLGYLAALLEHFHPGPRARAYRQDVTGLTRAFGADTLDQLGRAVRFVGRRERGMDEVLAFTEELSVDLARSDAWFWTRFERLRKEMEAWGADHAGSVLGPRRGIGRAAAVVAAGLAAQACVQVVDPPPPDVSASDVQVVDPAPSDVSDYWNVEVVDPAPADVVDAGSDADAPMVWDPLPPDVMDGMDAGSDADAPMVWDPLPPDVMDAVADGASDADAPMVWDPLPPDVMDALGDSSAPPADGQAGDGVGPVDALDAQDTDAPMVWDPLPPDVTRALDAPGSADPLHRAFRVRLSAARDGDGVELQAVVSGAEAVDLSWERGGGVLVDHGDGRARFVADGTGSPWVLVRARSGSHLLDVARHLPSDVRPPRPLRPHA